MRRFKFITTTLQPKMIKPDLTNLTQAFDLLGFDFALEGNSFAVLWLLQGLVVAAAAAAVVAPVGHGVQRMRMRLSGSHIQCHQLQ